MEDCLVVTYDAASFTDDRMLLVTRHASDRVEELSKFEGDKALLVYYLLTGYGDVKKDNSEIDEIIFQLKCIREHLVYLYHTKDIDYVDFDSNVLEGCISRLEKLKEGQHFMAIHVYKGDDIIVAYDCLDKTYHIRTAENNYTKDILEFPAYIENTEHEPKRFAHWVFTGPDDTWFDYGSLDSSTKHKPICSSCGLEFDKVVLNYKRCPNCGAYMFTIEEGERLGIFGVDEDNPEWTWVESSSWYGKRKFKEE